MTDWYALEECLQRAEANGYECRIPHGGRIITEDGYICGGSLDGDAVHYYQVIFSYDFASAFFLTEEMTKGDKINNMIHHHLQEMVILENKIEYLKRFL